MNTNQEQFGRAWGRLSQAVLLLMAIVLIVTTAKAQTQRKPKGPRPPSYDEVLQRALEEKKSATNAPVAPLPSAKASPPSIATPAVKPPTDNATANSVDALLQEAKATKPQPQPSPKNPLLAREEPAVAVVAPAAVIISPTTVAQPEGPRVQPAPVVSATTEVTKIAAPITTPAPATQPVPVSATPPTNRTSGKSKGPVFSPLPSDLSPKNEVPQRTSTSTASISAASAASANVMETLDDKHLLAIGDRLSFRIVEDGEDPRQLTVMDSGELEVPYLGRFAAEGKSCQELARALKAELEKQYYYQATVILAVDLMARSRGKVYLVGPVRVPGPLEIPSDEVLTLSKAILRAGGFTDFADKKNVKVTRKGGGSGGGDQSFMVNVSEVLEKGRSELDLPLQPGDLVYIQERLIRF